MSKKLFPYGEELPKNSGETPFVLSITSHTDPMKTHIMQVAAVVALALLSLIVWGFVLWMSTHVSLIILQTLDAIVELAALTP